MSHGTQHEHHRRVWYVPMLARDTLEEHRAATPLELFFDLCFVVAVAIAASNLHHDVVEGHAGDGLLGYALAFFAIWWAWMNFTWFASAYDTDDPPYRITTFVQMAGVLVLAAGIPRAFEASDIGLMTAGYVVMRLAMVTQWLRASRTDVERRSCALRYAGGVSTLQVLWVARLALPEELNLPSIGVLVFCELAVPIWAEQASNTTWHPHHVAERYGLFTIIVLGESILAATVAFQSAFDAGFHDSGLIILGVASLVIVFSMWWLYFDQAEHPERDSVKAAFAWGYGHLFVFAAAAAVGAGIAVAVDYETGQAVVGATGSQFAVALPVALFLLSVWLIHVLPNRTGVLRLAFPGCALLVAASPLTGVGISPAALLLGGLVALMIFESRNGVTLQQPGRAAERQSRRSDRS